MSLSYPKTPTDTEPNTPNRDKNVVGVIALITSVIGFVFACIPGALIVGWILLPVAFILAIVGVALPGRRKGTSITALILSVVGTIVGVLVFTSAIFGAVDDAFNDSASAQDSGSAQTDGSVSQEKPVDDEEAQGSRENPLAVGDEFSTEDWTISIDTPHEATSDVLDENPFNDKPTDGFEYWIIPITATYTGDETGEPMLITTAFVSSDSHTYDAANSSCGVVPDPLDQAGELYPDATATGNVCLQVPAEADGLWSITADLLDDPVFFTTD